MEEDKYGTFMRDVNALKGTSSREINASKLLQTDARTFLMHTGTLPAITVFVNLASK